MAIDQETADAIAKKARTFSEADLEPGVTNPLYAAWVRANGMTVPQGRNDIFTRWIKAERNLFLAERFAGYPKVSTREVELRIMETQVEFTSWLTSRYPAPQPGPMPSI